MGSENLHHRKKTGALKRERNIIREYKNSILIICEGKETEPNYFKKFPTNNVKVKPIGTGTSNITLIGNAVSIWELYAAEGKYYESLWCVFDRDDFPQEKYNQAFASIANEERVLNRKYRKKTGRKVKINIAYSNQAFELWYLLHFDYIDTGLHRWQYKDMLSHSQRMNRKYEKNYHNMYSLLEGIQDTAVRNAKRLEASINGQSKHNHNPSTTVYKLVEELNTYL